MSPSHCIPATNSLREKLGSPPVTVTPTPTLSASRSTAKVAMVPRLIQLSIPSLSPPELFLPCRPSPRARSSRERRLWSLSDTFKLARRTTSFGTRVNCPQLQTRDSQTGSRRHHADHES